jgi:hypothetical protein
MPGILLNRAYKNQLETVQVETTTKMKQNKGILLNRAYKSQLETMQVESTRDHASRVNYKNETK